MAPRRIADTLQRLRSEYLDMPRLSLTPGQVAQILNIDPPTARGLLHTLEASHFLERTRDGRFAGVVPRPELHDCALCRQPRAHGSPAPSRGHRRGGSDLGMRGLPAEADPRHR